MNQNQLRRLQRAHRRWLAWRREADDAEDRLEDLDVLVCEGRLSSDARAAARCWIENVARRARSRERLWREIVERLRALVHPGERVDYGPVELG
jgi:hypothetical protein